MNCSILKNKKWLPWAVLTAVYLILVIFFALFGQHYLYGDASTDLVMANFLNKEGTILSQNLYYTSEIRLFNVVNVYQLALKLFPDNWHAARTLSVALLLPMLAGSFIYLGRSVGKGNAAVWAAAAVIMPLNWYYAFLVSYGLAYSCVCIMVFLQAGLLFRLVSRRDPDKKAFVPRLLLLLGLSFGGGLTGIRMLMIYVIPVGLASLISLLLQAWRCSEWKAVIASRQGKLFRYMLLNTAATLAGYVCYSRFLKTRFSSQSFEYTMVSDFRLTDLLDQFTEFAWLLGSRGPVSFSALNADRTVINTYPTVMSVSGVLCVAAVGLAIYLLASPVLLLLCRKKLMLSSREKDLTLLTLTSVVCGILINWVTDTTGGFMPGACYYMPGALLTFYTGFLLPEKVQWRLPGIRRFTLLALLSLFMVMSAHTLYSNNFPKTETAYEKAAQWLVENGYTQGYATYWNSPVLTEASDGRVEMWTLNAIDKPEQVQAWGQAKWHTLRQPSGKVFFFYVGDINVMEPVTLMSWMKREPEWAYVDDQLIYMIYADESTEALYAPMRDSLQHMEWYGN